MLNTPGGMPAFSGEHGERERGQRRFLRRLQHHRAAGRERGAGLARDHREREIPRRDRRDHADRFARHDDLRIRASGSGSRRRSCAWLLPRTIRRSSPHSRLRRVASASGLPCSRVSSSASASRFSSINSPQRFTRAPRSFAVSARQAGKARSRRGDGLRSFPPRRPSRPRRSPRRSRDSDTGYVSCAFVPVAVDVMSVAQKLVHAAFSSASTNVPCAARAVRVRCVLPAV